MHDEDFDSLASERNIDARCDEFQRALTNGQSPKIESFLGGTTPLEYQQLLKELLGLEVDFRITQHEQPMLSDYDQRFRSLLVHPAMLGNEAPRQVLVMGGGDGLAIRECLVQYSVYLAAIGLLRKFGLRFQGSGRVFAA